MFGQSCVQLTDACMINDLVRVRLCDHSYTITAPLSANNASSSNTVAVSLMDLVTSDHPASTNLLFGWKCTPAQYAALAARVGSNAAANLYMVDARKTGGFYFSMGAFQQVPAQPPPLRVHVAIGSSNGAATASSLHSLSCAFR